MLLRWWLRKLYRWHLGCLCLFETKHSNFPELCVYALRTDHFYIYRSVCTNKVWIPIFLAIESTRLYVSLLFSGYLPLFRFIFISIPSLVFFASVCSLYVSFTSSLSLCPSRSSLMSLIFLYMIIHITKYAKAQLWMWEYLLLPPPPGMG